MDTATQTLAEITAGPGTLKRIDQAVELMWTTYQQPYFWAAMELWIASRHNPGIRAALEPAERQLYVAIRAAVDEMFGSVHTKKARYAKTRELLLTSMRGVALTYSFDSRDPARDHHLAQWKSMAKVMLGP
jgi:hypothetical protein